MRQRRPVLLKDNENTLQYSCVEHLKRRKLPGVWFHHSPNECVREGTAIHQWKMGMLSGFWDLVIFKPILVPCTGVGRWVDEPHWFEVKHGDGRLTNKEDQFRGMLYERCARHRVVRDVDVFISQCLEWELIK